MRLASALLVLSSLVGRGSTSADEPIPVGSPPPPIMSVYVVGPGTRSELALPAGKEVDVIDGDLVIQSPYLTAVIARPVEGRNANLTTNDVGGCLIDLTTTERGSDQLTVFRPHGPNVAYRKWSIAIDGEPEKMEDDSGWGLVRQVSLTVATADDTQQATYSLNLNSRYLNLKVESNDNVPDAEFRLDGGSTRVGMSPTPPDDWFWAEDVYWGQAYGIRAFASESGDPLSIARNGRNVKPLGATNSVNYKIAPGRTRLHAWGQLFPEAINGWLKLHASYLVRPSADRRTPSPSNDNVIAFANTTIATKRGDNEDVIGMVRLQANETLIVPVPTGPVSVAMESHGLKSKPGRYHITKGQSVSHRSAFLNQQRPVRLIVRDEAGWPIPAKVEIRATADDAKIDFGPDSAVKAVKDLVYIATGEQSVALPPGRYELIASHGPEFHVTKAEFEVPGVAGSSGTSNQSGRLSVAPGTSRDVSVARQIGTPIEQTLTLRSAFKSPGWISADFHSHSSPSGDNISDQRGRVLNLVCEDIDFAPCTEHNRISSYQSHIDELGLGNHILSCSGIELTGRPLPLNHQNVFPLVHKPFKQNGGGPYVADNPDEQIERLYLWDDRSEKVIQENHPDIGWLFRDRDGDGTVDEGFARGVSLLDGIEIHPVEAVLELFPDADDPKGEVAASFNRGRFVHWLQLLNQGRRLTGVVNTDAHYNHHGSGWLRNWIAVPNDEPTECSLESIIEATKAGRVIMSNGPMIELAVLKGDGEEAGLGEEVRSESGTVRAKVRVRCADWVHCDRVAILVGGRPTHVFDTSTTPDAFHDDVVVFEQTVDVNVAADAPVLAICGSKSKTLGEIYGKANAERHFAAATNAIWVNVGDEKWEPSNDTLDVPLTGKMK